MEKEQISGRKQIYGFAMITAEEISEIEQSGRTWILDLREKESFEEGHLPHAIHAPYEQMEYWKRHIPEYGNVILYCEHGNLSLLAARKLRGRKGNIYTLRGGYQSYR